MPAPEFQDAVRATIVIPAYNAVRFIEDTLASAAAQTERRIEILVVDDCSTDETPALVERASAADSRIRLLRTPRNGGPSASCNIGFAAARGAWIAILDADDTYEPERIEVLLALGEARGADLVADNLLRVYESGDAPSAPMMPLGGGAAEFELDLADFYEGLGDGKSRSSYGFLQPIFRRAFLERHGLRFDEDMRLAEDFALYARALHAGASWWVTRRPMYRYLVRRGSLSEAHPPEAVDPLWRLDQALLRDPAVQANRRLARAIRRHAAGLERYRHYRPFTDALKARAWRRAAGVLFASRRAFSRVSAECLVQAPVIAAKALRGGYRRQPS